MTYNDIIEYGKRIFNVDLTIESDPIFGNRLISKVDLPDVYANPWINPNDYELSNSEKQWTAPASAIIARRLKVYGGSTSDGRAQILLEKTILNKILPEF